MGLVTIGRSPGKGSADRYFPVSKFLPILKEYADIWDVDILARWPKYRNSKRISGKQNTVVVNFFHEKEKRADDDGRSGEKSSAFGYVFREAVPCVKSSIYSGFTRIQKLEFFDFDDSLLAHVDHEEGECITIDFDFLRTCWEEHEEALRIILAWGLTQTSANLGSFAQVDRFAEHLKKRFAQSVTEARTKFFHYQQWVARESLAHYTTKLSQSMRKSVESEAWYVRATRRREEFDAIDLESVDMQKADQFADDFDRMRKLFGVAKIVIDRGKVVIITHRLDQMYPPPYEQSMPYGKESKPYDVGSIKFSIDPSYESYQGIDFAIHEDGEYKNAYFQAAGNMCLGTNSGNGGMNMAVAKLLVKFKIPDIVALVLTFFRFVHSEPTKNPKFIGKEEEEGQAAVYAERNWEREKQSYIALMMHVAAKRGKKGRDAVRAELSTEQMNAFSAAKNCWTAAAELEHVRLRVETRAVGVAEEAVELVDDLEKHPAVLGFDLEHGLRIWFEHRNVFMFPSLLWIQENGSVRLITLLTSHGRTRDNAILWDWRGDRVALDLVACGEYADVVSHIIKLTTHWFEYSQSSHEG